MTSVKRLANTCLTVIVAGCLMVFAAASYASQCTAVEPFNQLKPVGKTRLQVWFWDVYDAELRTETGAYEDAEQRALQLSYLRDIEAQDLVDTTAEEWQRLNIALTDTHNQWLQQLQQMWPDVQKGDCITLVETAAGHAQFFGPEGELGVIRSAQFTNDFLAIWLDEKSRFKSERNELIGAQQ
ncbi:chalcone isomerase family protein [Pseudidiomarina donghaiensis]|uniref:chalcone isomerase family protein n=1 Tax=Pseudidiomarina donghaiensis TaxID=519452 RepID=UPI0008EDB10B|nr:chalcone isomerase family protein [Pseudidiomarina donghaiensis]SFV24832.1 Chalcone isomerase-like [Pseudidiomarina donghaiensis]